MRSGGSHSPAPPRRGFFSKGEPRSHDRPFLASHRPHRRIQPLPRHPRLGGSAPEMVRRCPKAAVRQFLRDDEQLAETRYYTANPFHLDKGVQQRHSAYVAAVQGRNGESFIVQRGHFKEKIAQISFTNGMASPSGVQEQKSPRRKGNRRGSASPILI